MNFMRGLKRFGKGLGNMAMNVGSALAPMAGMALGARFGGPMGAMVGQTLGAGLGQEMGRHQFGGHGARKGVGQNPNQFMPMQGQFGNVPMGELGGAMGQHFANQYQNNPMMQALGQAGGQMMNQYAQRHLSPEMQQMQYGQMPQYMQGRMMQAGQERLAPHMPQQGPTSFYGSQGQPMSPEQQNQAAFAELPFAGGYAHGGHIHGYHMGGMPRYAAGGNLGLRELADLIHDAAGSAGGMENQMAPAY